MLFRAMLTEDGADSRGAFPDAPVSSTNREKRCDYPYVAKLYFGVNTWSVDPKVQNNLSYASARGLGKTITLP